MLEAHQHAHLQIDELWSAGAVTANVKGCAVESSTSVGRGVQSSLEDVAFLACAGLCTMYVRAQRTVVERSMAVIEGNAGDLSCLI